MSGHGKLATGRSRQVATAGNNALRDSLKWWNSIIKIKKFMRLLNIVVPHANNTKASLGTLLAMDQEFNFITEASNDGFGAQGNLAREAPAPDEGPDYEPHSEEEEDE